MNKINSFGRGSHRDYKWGLPSFLANRFWSDFISSELSRQSIDGSALLRLREQQYDSYDHIVYTILSLAVTEGSDEQAIGAGLSATSGHEKLGAACAGQNSGRGRWWRPAVDEGVTQIWKTKKI